MKKTKKIAKQGGNIAGNTRKEIEEKTGKKVVSNVSAKKLLADVKKMVDDEKKKTGWKLMQLGM